MTFITVSVKTLTMLIKRYLESFGPYGLGMLFVELVR